VHETVEESGGGRAPRSRHLARRRVDRDDLRAGHIAELGPILPKDGRRELGQEGIRQVKVDVEALESRKHRDLDGGKDLAAARVPGMRDLLRPGGGGG